METTGHHARCGGADDLSQGSGDPSSTLIIPFLSLCRSHDRGQGLHRESRIWRGIEIGRQKVESPSCGPFASSPRGGILDALHQYGPGSSEDLAAWTGLHRVSVSPRLKPLEERGVVSRRGRKRNLRGQRVIEWAVADAK